MLINESSMSVQFHSTQKRRALKKKEKKEYAVVD